jgi:hypothetical protein
LGIDAVGQAGGIVEAAVCYTGDVTDPKRGLYDLEYYLSFVRELEAIGIHVLAIKDMVRLETCLFLRYVSNHPPSDSVCPLTFTGGPIETKWQ